MVRWTMWPATSMMIAAALASILIAFYRQWREKAKDKTADKDTFVSKADESLPRFWLVMGAIVCVAALIRLQDDWFAMPWQQVLFAVALQPPLIVGGLRVLGLTGQGPVSLMANATQFVFGLMWPARLMQNLNAAHIAADPQASAESTVSSFWVAQRLGGRFTSLIIAQLIVLPVSALLLMPVFNLLQKTYGIGTQAGQLSAPTALKIASLAIVMEKGKEALPHGALLAAIIAAVIGIALELLMASRIVGPDGKSRQRFGWVPVPSALGFALILPPPLTIALAIGSVASAGWKKLAPTTGGSHELYCPPIGAGLVAGDAVVAGVLLPLAAVIFERIGNLF